jgi:hypothetical protein
MIKRKFTRLALNTYKLTKKFFSFLSAIFKAFFDIRENDGLGSRTKKVGATAIRRVVFIAADYWTALACAGLVSILNYWGRSFLEITAATWAYDLAIATVFLGISLKSGQDITLGESFRRAADVVHSANKMAGYITFAGLAAKATIWDGPEQVVIFFKKEIKTITGMLVILTILTLVQGLFWAWLYSLGYDSVTDLIKN